MKIFKVSKRRSQWPIRFGQAGAVYCQVKSKLPTSSQTVHSKPVLFQKFTSQSATKTISPSGNPDVEHIKPVEPEKPLGKTLVFKTIT